MRKLIGLQKSDTMKAEDLDIELIQEQLKYLQIHVESLLANKSRVNNANEKVSYIDQAGQHITKLIAVADKKKRERERQSIIE